MPVFGQISLIANVLHKLELILTKKVNRMTLKFTIFWSQKNVKNAISRNYLKKLALVVLEAPKKH